MNESDFLWKLKRYIAETYGTNRDAAREWGVSAAFISSVTTGQKRPPEWMLKEIGYKRNRIVTITYEKISG